MKVELPWPDRDLHPNARVHWGAKSKATKKARAYAHWVTLGGPKVDCVEFTGRFDLWLDFYPPDRRKRDDDGLLAAFKPYRDGIADALEMDDNRFISHPRVMDETRPGGLVVVRITPANQGETK